MDYNEVLNPTEYVKHMGNEDILKELKSYITETIESLVDGNPKQVSKVADVEGGKVKLYVSYETDYGGSFDYIKHDLNKLALSTAEYQNVVMSMFKNNELPITTKGIDKKDLEDISNTSILLDDPREVTTMDKTGDKIYSLRLNLTLKDPTYQEPVQDTTTTTLPPEK